MSKNVKMNFNPKKVIDEYNKSFSKARMKLKSEIAKDSSPFVPMRDGKLDKTVNESIGKDDNYLIWDFIGAKFLYYGKVMVGIVTRSTYARKGERKETIGKDLKYFKGRRPQAGSFWFERAKKIHSNRWIDNFKKNGGKR